MGILPEKIYDWPNWRRTHGEPQNRRQLFQCVLTDQFFSMIPVNLLYLLFWLPAALWSALCVFQVLAAVQANDGTAAVGTINSWMLGLIPCITVTGPGKAGMALLMRNWAAEEYTPVLSTFRKGLRENWKQTLLPSFLTGLLPMAIWSTYQMCAGGSMLLLWIVCAVAALFLMAMQIYYVLLVTYALRPIQHFRNAVLLLFMKLPVFLLVFIGSLTFVILAAVFAALFPNAGWLDLLLPMVYYSTVGLAVTALIRASFANWLREKYLSPEES